MQGVGRGVAFGLGGGGRLFLVPGDWMRGMWCDGAGMGWEAARRVREA